MKVKMLIAAVLASALLPATAQGFVWHLPMSTARAENIRFARGVCEEDSECIAWNGRRCQRVSESRVDCILAGWYPGYYEGEEIQCDTIMHWGVNRYGEVELRRRGRPHCFAE